MLIANRWTTDEKLTAAKIAGCLTGLAGTAVLIGPALGSATHAPVWALVLPVLAAICYGFAGTFGKRFRGIRAPVTATGQLTASSLMMLPVAVLADQPWSLPLPSLGAISAILGLALLSTAFAYLRFSGSSRWRAQPTRRWSPYSFHRRRFSSAPSSWASGLNGRRWREWHLSGLGS
ncbi:drug/metabolite transporter (DMT)-like permease [Pseudorhizobium tarimense]|uniref:Drug/metabolite transporter (DMT)-like permease n=1 Tax=Pseudorhizobium tarimense TaxID=1079109 RepID=A0ABV2H3L8_9HYPH